MTVREFVPRAALVATPVCLLLAFYSDSYAAWGLDYFKYLGSSAIYLLIALTAIVLYLAFGPVPQTHLERAVEKTGDLLWGKASIIRWLLALGMAGLFFVFRVGTAFLGDGYFLLNIFGRDEAYTGGPIKLLSFWVIKLVQQAFGGYSYWTALYAFQAVSILAGLVVVYNFIAIAGLIADSARGRLFSLVVLLGSGWMLLFLGYIEYYPMLWLAVSFFVRTALAYAKDRGSLWLVLLLFALSVAIHMQALFYLPGVLYLLLLRIMPRAFESLTTRTFASVVATMILLVPAVVVIVGRYVSSPDNPFLPLISGTSGPSLYAAFSVQNLAEIGNLIALCLPTILVLLSLSFERGDREVDHIHRLLVLFSFGSLAFLVTINPRLGLARDWDLMAITLLAPGLLLIYRSTRSKILSPRIVFATAVLAAGVVVPFLSVNCSAAGSTARMHDLLRYYGPRERGGWVSFAKYIQNDGNLPLYNEVTTEMAAIFPEQRSFQVARSLIAKGKLADAEVLVTELLKQQPDNGEFLAALGDIRLSQGRLPEAKESYKKALITHPNHVNYYNLGRICMMTGDYADAVQPLEQAHRLSPKTEEILSALCRAYVVLKQTASAKQIADELLAVNPKSPVGHMVEMIYLVENKRTTEAAVHYRAFLESGVGHPDYESIKRDYAWLLGKTK